MKCGDILKRVRSERGMTQARLSELTGIDPATIRKYENGQYPITEKAAARMAEALKINPDTFIIQKFTASSAMQMLFLLFYYYRGELKTIKESGFDDNGKEYEVERTFVSFYALEPLMKYWKKSIEAFSMISGNENIFQYLERFPIISDMKTIRQGKEQNDDILLDVLAMFDNYIESGNVDYSYLNSIENPEDVRCENEIAAELLEQIIKMNTQKKDGELDHYKSDPPSYVKTGTD